MRSITSSLYGDHGRATVACRLRLLSGPKDMANKLLVPSVHPFNADR